MNSHKGNTLYDPFLSKTAQRRARQDRQPVWKTLEKPWFWGERLVGSDDCLKKTFQEKNRHWEMLELPMTKVFALTRLPSVACESKIPFHCLWVSFEWYQVLAKFWSYVIHKFLSDLASLRSLRTPLWKEHVAGQGHWVSCHIWMSAGLCRPTWQRYTLQREVKFGFSMNWLDPWHFPGYSFCWPGTHRPR